MKDKIGSSKDQPFHNLIEYVEKYQCLWYEINTVYIIYFYGKHIYRDINIDTIFNKFSQN